MKGVSIRHSGKFPWSIQCLRALEGKVHDVRHCICYRWPFKPLQASHDVERQIHDFQTGKTCRKYENLWNSLKQFSLLHQIFIYRGIAPGTDHPEKQTNQPKKSFVSCDKKVVFWLLHFLDYLAESESSNQDVKDILECGDINHQDTKNLSLCL